MTVITSVQCFEDVPCRINVSEHWLQKGEGEGVGLKRWRFPHLEWDQGKGRLGQAAVAGGFCTPGKEVPEDRKSLQGCEVTETKTNSFSY